MTHPPRFLFRPRIGALLTCWLFGHRWVRHVTLTMPRLNPWATEPFDCVRCGERVEW